MSHASSILRSFTPWFACKVTLYKLVEQLVPNPYVLSSWFGQVRSNPVQLLLPFKLEVSKHPMMVAKPLKTCRLIFNQTMHHGYGYFFKAPF